MASIRIPAPLRAYTDGNEHVTISGRTVDEGLRDLAGQYPALEKHLFTDGKLRSFVNVFIGEEDIRFLDGVDTPVKEDDRLMIIPSIAGG